MAQQKTFCSESNFLRNLPCLGLCNITGGSLSEALGYSPQQARLRRRSSAISCGARSSFVKTYLKGVKDPRSLRRCCDDLYTVVCCCWYGSLFPRVPPQDVPRWQCCLFRKFVAHFGPFEGDSALLFPRSPCFQSELCRRCAASNCRKESTLHPSSHIALKKHKHAHVSTFFIHM